VLDTGETAKSGSISIGAAGEVQVGLRPSTPDSLPVLGRAPTARNIYLATGRGATGLQVGTYSGKLIADLALGKTIDQDLDPFASSRF
jgi:D-amino-acid dehydrogenase